MKGEGELRISSEEEGAWKAIQSLKDELNGLSGLVVQGNNSYYFSCYEVFYHQEPSEFFQSEPQVTWELIAASEVVLEFKTRSERYWANDQLTWDGPSEPIEPGPRLYRLSGCSKPEEYIDIASKKIYRDFVRVDLGPSGSIEVTHFPAFSECKFENDISALREFFNRRGLRTGIFDINRINDAILDLFMQKEYVKTRVWLMKYLPRLTNPEEEYESNTSNCLAFDAHNSSYFFQFEITQDPHFENRDLVEALHSVFDFVFRGIGEFVRSGASFEEWLPSYLEVAPSALETLLEPIGEIDLFFDHWGDRSLHEGGPRQDGDAGLWFTPRYIQVFVRRQKNDPSFGVPTEHSEQQLILTETIENYQRTRFEGIDPESYLARLARQTADNTHKEKMFGIHTCFHQ